MLSRGMLLAHSTGRGPVKLQPCAVSTSSLCRLLVCDPHDAGSVPDSCQFLFRYRARSAGNAPLSDHADGNEPCSPPPHILRDITIILDTSELMD